MGGSESSLAWLDYSEAERRQMNEVISLFRDKGILDELGVGYVRDAFADLLFPGTSTIQTRARYFLFIPWIYLDLESREVPSSEVAQAAREEQVRLIYALEKGGEKDTGTVGIEAREHLLRLPSSIYWVGLGQWGIRRFPGTMDQYHRSLDAYHHRLSDAPVVESDEPMGRGVLPNWHPEIPRPPRRWLKSTDFSLTHEEADFLRDRIIAEQPASLLAALVQREDDVSGIDAPWAHPEFDSLPRELQKLVQHAERFSSVMFGATLVYHALLAEASESENLLTGHLEGLRDWIEHLRGRLGEFQGWDRQEFWKITRSINPRVPFTLKRFVDAWIELALSVSDPFSSEPVRRLIVEREYQLKRRLARLTNPAALETWVGSPQIRPLSYRWPNVRTIVTDIFEGLSQRAELPAAGVGRA